MKKYFLTRPQVALLLICQIFRELDEYEIAEILEKATGHTIEPAEFDEDIGDAWECSVPFSEELANWELPGVLELLKVELNQFSK